MARPVRPDDKMNCIICCKTLKRRYGKSRSRGQHNTEKIYCKTCRRVRQKVTKPYAPGIYVKNGAL